MHVNDEFIQEIGLEGMPATEKQAFMAHAEEELEVRVGQRISQELTEAQLREFEGIQDDYEATEWLERNVPSFREMVEQVFVAFKNELLAERETILGDR